MRKGWLRAWVRALHSSPHFLSTARNCRRGVGAGKEAGSHARPCLISHAGGLANQVPASAAGHVLKGLAAGGFCVLHVRPGRGTHGGGHAQCTMRVGLSTRMGWGWQLGLGHSDGACMAAVDCRTGDARLYSPGASCCVGTAAEGCARVPEQWFASSFWDGVHAAPSAAHESVTPKRALSSRCYWPQCQLRS